MPEMHDDEHVQRAQAILKGHGEAYVLERLKLMIYNASNNFTGFRMSRGGDDDWKAVVSMLREGGILDIKLDISTTQDETLLAFFETLFKQAIHRANSTNEISYESGMEVLKWLSKSGIDLDQQTCFSRIPLQFCLDYGGGNLNVLRLLLESGANPSLVKLDGCRLSRARLHGSGYYMKARFLFERGAVADSLDELLHMALLNRDLEFVSTLISRHNADPASILEPVDPHTAILYEESALCVAAGIGIRGVNFVLDNLRLRYPSIPPPTFITPDAYIAAAYLGSEDVTRLFLELNPATLCANGHGITALHVAAENGHYVVCQLLLPRLSGAAFPQQYPTPLHLAIRKANREVAQLFIENGVDVNSKGTGIISKYMEYWEEPRTPLQEAIQYSYSFSCISDLLSAGADYSGVGIYEAAKSGNDQLIFLVLTASTDPNTKDDGSAITLQRILRADHEYVLDHPKFKALARSLLDTEVQLLGGEIVGAIRRGWWDIITSLTANRSLIDTDIYGRTTIEEAIMSVSCRPKFMDDVFEAYRYSYEPGSLCAAVWDKNLLFVKRLLASRPENMSPNILESTALGLAAALGLPAIVKELLAVLPMTPALIPLYPENCKEMRTAGKNMLKDQKNVMFWNWKLENNLATGSLLALAALTPSPELFNSLLEHGYRSDSLTWLACAGLETVEMLELLLKHGQHISRDATGVHQNIHVLNPLNIAIVSPMAQQRIKLLLRAGVDVKTSSQNGEYISYTPLHLAIKEGRADVISELLKAGADVNASSTTNFGESFTPLQLAVKNGDADMIINLLKAGADVNASPGEEFGATALQFAAINGHIGLAKHLLELGALANAPRSPFRGRTALEGAAEHGRLDMVRFLLEKGALIHNTGRRQYVRAVGFAIKERHLVVAEMLKVHGDWGDSDQQILENDYGGDDLDKGDRVWEDDIGQMPQTDEDREIGDLTEEVDSPGNAINIVERDGAASESPEDRFPDAPMAVVGVVEDSNASGDDDVASAVHSWLNGELAHSTPT